MKEFRALRPKKNPEVAIIMLTGDSNRDFAMDSGRFGVEDYLVKGEFDARSHGF